MSEHTTNTPVSKQGLSLRLGYWHIVLGFLLVCVSALVLPNAPAYASGNAAYTKVARNYGASWTCVRLLLHCIKRESGGNPACVYHGHVGILQYNANWGSYRNRRSVAWSIRTFVKGYKRYGPRWVNKHWCRWHGCGGYAMRVAGSR